MMFTQNNSGKIQFRHLFLAGMFGFVALWWVSLAWERQAKKVVKTAPLPPATTQQVYQQSAAPIPNTLSIRKLDQIETELNQRNQIDDQDLGQLMDSAKEILHTHATDTLLWFSRFASRMSQRSIETSLFVTQAWIQHHPQPIVVLDHLMRVTPPRHSTNFSHSNFSPEAKINIIKIYALEQIGERLKREPKYAVGMKKLVPTLIKIASQEPDLALAREAAQRLRQIHPNAEELLRKIIRSRAKEDRFAFDDLLV